MAKSNMSINMEQVSDYLSEQKYPNQYSASEKRTLRKRSENFVIKDGVLYYCFGWKHLSEAKQNASRLREVIGDERKKVNLIMTCHRSNKARHLGHQKIIQKLSQDYYWIGMHADVRRILKRCHSCVLGREVVMDTDTVGNEGEETANSVPQSSRDECEGTDEIQEVFHVFPIHSPENTYVEAKQFWERVEFDIVGPYPASPDSEEVYFVALFMDSYSAWTEAFVLDNSLMSTMLMPIFQLICRYGVMTTLVPLKKKLFKGLQKPLSVFAEMGCPISVEATTSLNLESRWKELRKGVEDFIVNSPMEWYYYMEFCLLPFRISRPERMDYTPSYLSTAREIRLPTSVNHQTSANHIELHLSETQISQSLSSMKEMFVSCVNQCDMIKDRKQNSSKTVTELGVEESSVMTPADEDSNDDSSMGPASTRGSPRKKPRLMQDAEEHPNNYGNFYEAIKNHILGKGYPPGYTMSMKRTTRKVASGFVVKNDTLFYKGTSDTLREVAMYEEDRWKLLQKYHLDYLGNHLNSKETYKRLCEKYYWKGISLDTRAFVHACPHCLEGGNKEKQNTKTFKVVEDILEITSDYSDCTDKYQPIIEFLKTKELPKKMSQENEKSFRATSLRYTLDDDGVLYYKDASYADKSGDRLRRQVVFTPEEKRRYFKECHIDLDTGKHQSKAMTRVSISKKYYWPQMSQEVARLIRNCEVCSGQGTVAQSPAATSTPATTPMVTRRASRKHVTPATPTIKTTEPVSPVKKQQEQKQKFDERKEKFSRMFETGELYVAIVENVNSDHGYSIQSPSTEEVNNDSDQENLSEVAGNEIEIKTDSSSARPSSLDPLSAAVELALAGEKSAAPEGEDSAETTSLEESNNTTAKEKNTPIANKTKGDKYVKYQCSLCGYLARGPVKLQIHMSSHTGEKPFTCTTCGAKVSTTKSIRQHYLRHRGELHQKKFLCDICGKDFKFKQQLKNHKQSVHSKPLTCGTCEQSFLSDEALAQHEKDCNPGGHVCKICHQVCSGKRDLRAHILSHVGLGVKERPQRIGQSTPETEVTELTEEETLRAATQVEIPTQTDQSETVSVEIELPQGAKLNTSTNAIEIPVQAISAANQTSTGTSAAGSGGQPAMLISNEHLGSSLLTLAEQVVQAELGEGGVECQIFYPDNTSEILILQHEALE